MCIIGDQIVTDILAGNRYKIYTVLVDPLGEKDLKITGEYIIEVESRLNEGVKDSSSKEVIADLKAQIPGEKLIVGAGTVLDVKYFSRKNGDELDSNDLSQFLWDMQYWLNSSTLPIEELVIKIGLFYYTSDIEKSNVYLISTLVRKLNSNANYNLTLERLDALSKRPSLSGFKFFSEEEDESAIKGKVQIMTLHKSKGDEFEYVFMPEFSEKMLSIDVNRASLKSSTTFMEEIRGFNPKYKVKSELELKEFSAEESMRLFYVAVTRARKRLIIIPMNIAITAEPIRWIGSRLSSHIARTAIIKDKIIPGKYFNIFIKPPDIFLYK